LKDQLVKEFLYLNRKLNHLNKRIKKDQNEMVKIEMRIKEIERIMEGKK
jgi:wobble nucleotide-excising tRNase